MAEWQQIEKAQRMEDSLILQIGADLPLQRLQVGKNIAVRDHHAAGLGRRAGGEYDLDDVVARYSGIADRPVRELRDCFAQRLQLEVRHAWHLVMQSSNT